MIPDGLHFIKASDLAVLHRKDSVQAKEVKANAKRVIKENPKVNNTRKATRAGKTDRDPIHATDDAPLIETDLRHRGENALEDAPDQALPRLVRLA